MPQFQNIPKSVFETILGEESLLEITHFQLKNRSEALNFIMTYGFDLSKASDLEKVWSYHRVAVEYFESEILPSGSKVPGPIRNREELGEIVNLFDLEEQPDLIEKSLRKWSCALLKVMHILVHLDHDLFSSFKDEIQYQILRPLQEHVHETEEGLFLGEGQERVELVEFQVKPIKHTYSAVTKLLSKKQAIAMTLLDRVGVRFVTPWVSQIFQVISYMVNHHMLSFPHVIQHGGKNSICPTEVFFKAIKKYKNKWDTHEFCEYLNEQIQDTETRTYALSENPFSHQDFKFLKFINRQLLNVRQKNGDPYFKFFYPFEVQVLDEKTYKSNLIGPAEHDSYKERQREEALRRLFGKGFNIWEP